MWNSSCDLFFSFLFFWSSKKSEGVGEKLNNLLGGMLWTSFLRVGDAYAADRMTTADGFRYAWRALFPSEIADWLPEHAGESDMNAMAAQWADVWWHYLCGLQGVPPDSLSEEEAMCVVHLGCESLSSSARRRSVFLAVLFQIAVAERHDQMLCGISGNPKQPPFYSDYISRSKMGSMFSLRSLLECENRYECARRTVSRFRGVRGRVVAEVYAPGGEELVRLERTKLKRFMCAKCATTRARSDCRLCTRMQESSRDGLVGYFGQNRAYNLVPDVQTVCGDVVFVPVEKLRSGQTVGLHDGDGAKWLRVVQVVCLPDKTVSVLCRGQGDKQVHLSRRLKAVLPVLPSAPDCVRMMRENPRVVHGMGLSVHPDRMEKMLARNKTKKPSKVSLQDTPPPFARKSKIHIKEFKNRHVKDYALWRSLVAVVACHLPKNAPKHVHDSMRVAETHCLHLSKSSFKKR